jgi:hypothetical protein
VAVSEDGDVEGCVVGAGSADEEEEDVAVVVLPQAITRLNELTLLSASTAGDAQVMVTWSSSLGPVQRASQSRVPSLLIVSVWAWHVTLTA